MNENPLLLTLANIHSKMVFIHAFKLETAFMYETAFLKAYVYLPV